MNVAIVLPLLGQQVNVSAPITASKIVTAILFVLMLAWFVMRGTGIAR